MVEASRGIILRYEPGQFTFRKFCPTATDAQLYELAANLNAFQDRPLRRVLKVRVVHC
ncbi:MAG: hypothetical protein FWC70_11075 [Defluviitaleaceae bacterium]|nr:hypothetical protein [Defluviitaleaceae bacterium]